MTSSTVPSFWKALEALPSEINALAKKQFRLWRDNPSHPSLQFKKVGRRLWSARVTDDFRALCYFENGTHYWFWVGKHSEYDKILKGKS
jgi:hypothetical protein